MTQPHSAKAREQTQWRDLWHAQQQPVRAIVSLMALGSLWAEVGSWGPQMLVPRIPIIPGLSLPPSLETTLWLGLSACCLGFGFTRAWRSCGAVFAALFMIAVMTNVNRLSPYWFNYLCLGGVLYFPQPPGHRDPNGWIRPTLTILGIQYLWAGINKINPGFLNGGFLWFTELYIPSTQLPYWAIAGLMLSPLVEVCIGIGLLFRRTAIPAACVGMVMHAVLLFLLGPLGRGYGPAVWSWNLGLLALLVLAALKLRRKDTIWKPLNPLEAVLVSVLAIIPVANLFGNYMYFASYRLYTMNDTRGVLYLEEGVNPVVDHWRDTVVLEGGRQVSKIDLARWAVRSGVQTVYFDATIFRRSFVQLCPSDPERIARLVIKHRWSWLGQPAPETVVCNESLKLPSSSR